MAYREPPLDKCPPDDDFRTQRAERPDRIFRNITECQARGRSVRTDLDSAVELMKLRAMRGRMLYQVRLDHGAGRIMQTGEDPDHSTWWPLADYDILANCSLVST